MMSKKQIKEAEINVLPELTCPVCGKVFLPAPQHIYKDKRSSKRVCSWGCVCTSERLKARAKK